MVKKTNKKDKTKNYLNIYSILVLICLLLFAFGFYLIYSVQNISEYPEFERYRFNFYYLSDDGSSVNVSDAQFSYNFEKNLGKLTLNPEKNLKKAIIKLPKEYKLVEVVKIEPNKRIPVNVTLSLNESNEEKMVLIFNEDVKGDWILISFDMVLSPNSRFNILTNSIWEDAGNIYLDLGNDFKCPRNDCIFNLQNLEFSNWDADPTKTTRLRFVDQEGGINSPGFEFEITAHSISLVNSKNFKISLGASIIGGAIFALFAIVLAFYQSKRKY